MEKVERREERRRGEKRLGERREDRSTENIKRPSF